MRSTPEPCDTIRALIQYLSRRLVAGFVFAVAAQAWARDPRVILQVVAPPEVTKSFGAPTIPLHGATSLTLTLSNPNADLALTNVHVTDNLPAGIVIVLDVPDVLCTDGSTITITPGSINITADLPGGATCSVGVVITGVTAGHWTNLSEPVSSNEGTGGQASADIDVVAPPNLKKVEFSAASIPIGGAAFLTFTIENPNPSFTLNDLALVDNLPSGLVVDTPSGIDNQCGGTLTANPDASVVSLSGGTLGAGGTCTIKVRITGTSTGPKSNPAGPVSSSNGGVGNSANASIAVNSCTFGIAPPSAAFAPEASVGTVTVTTSAACGWTAISSNDSWLTTTSAGTGNGTVSYAVAALGPLLGRQATIRIGNQSFAVTQGVQPSNLAASAATPTSVGLTWTSTALGGGVFEIWRNDGHGPVLAKLPAGETTATSFTDLTAVEDTAYVYSVRAVSGPSASEFTNRDLAVTKFFSDDPLTIGTPIKLDHLIEHRAVIDLVRGSAGQSGFSYTAGLGIQAAQFNEFATALNDVWTSILSLPQFTLPPVVAGQPIAADPINALRAVLE